MPTYDYECDACQHKWEEFKSIKAPITEKCPECRKKKARRLIGPGAGLLFKGSGFYITDYRSDSYKESAAADSKKSSGGESSAVKTDTKPAESKTSQSTSKSGSRSSE